jgi:hypothetical protein
MHKSANPLMKRACPLFAPYKQSMVWSYSSGFQSVDWYRCSRLKRLAVAWLEDALFIALLHSRRLRRSLSGASEVSATLMMMREMISSGRRSQVPPTAFLFAGSMVMCSGKVEGKLMQVSMRLDIVPGCLCVFLGAADVAKSRSKGHFGSREPHVHYW